MRPVAPLSPPRAKPTRTLPLAVRVQPFAKELLRSFLARTANVSGIPYSRLIAELGLSTKRATAPWVGVDMTRREAAIVGALLRHEPDTILALQLPTHQSPNPEKVKHPQRYRACGECQTEHGAWFRWNADPLHIICPLHRTLFHSEGPQHQKLRNDKALTQRIAWPAYAKELSAELNDLYALQNLLLVFRREHPQVVKMFTKVLVAYQRAAQQTPNSEQLAFITERGHAVLRTHNRLADIDAKRHRITSSESIWASVEDTVAIFPAAAVFILEAKVRNAHQGYHELIEDLQDLAQSQAINTSSAEPYESDMVLGGPSALYDLDQLYKEWVQLAHTTPDLLELFNSSDFPHVA